MSLYQIAKVLEISGFIIATFFGTILFSKEYFSKFVEYFNNKLTCVRDKFNSWYSPTAQYLIRIEWFKNVAPTVIISFLEICIFAGWLANIKWLFLLGLIGIIPYVILIVPIGTFFLFRNDQRMDNMGQFPAYLVGMLVKTFVLVPIVFIPFFAILCLFTLLTLVLNMIAKEDFLKKSFIILGSVIAIIGLVLETKASW